MAAHRDPSAPAPAPASPRDPDASPRDPDAPAPAAWTSDEPAPEAWTSDEPAFEARVLSAFSRDGRLVSIPARERRRLVVYRYVLARVLPDPGELVHERDVNMRLALLYPDAATLRRALVDTGLAKRAGMTYQRAVPPRSGGS